MYLLESLRRGDSNKYPKRVFSRRITWDCQRKNTRSADFCADRIDVIMSFAVITNDVIKRVLCTTINCRGFSRFTGSLIMTFDCCMDHN